jgi:hypothetical protein
VAAGRDDAEYIALKLDESPEGRNQLELIAEFRSRIALISDVLSRAKEAAHAATAPQSQLFTTAHSGTDAWKELVSYLEAPAQSDRAAAEVLGVAAPSADTPADARPAVIEDVLGACESLLEKIREGIRESFRPNVPRAPLPAPYVLDFTPPRALLHTGTSFEVVRGRGRQRSLEDRPRVALVAAGVPESAYQQGEIYRYRVDESVAKNASEMAREAIAAAIEHEAQAIIFPECFIPDAAREELETLAAEHDLMLVGGVEQRFSIEGRVVNEAAVVLGSAPPGSQRKQRPSVYEARAPVFDADHRLSVFEDTILGTMGVVVCSDYLELDLVWRLASHEPRLDTLVVCSRNPNPVVFERLAVADAARLFASVIVVNSRPVPRDAGDSPDGSGTLVALPRREQPLADPLEAVTLDATGWECPVGAELLIYEIPIADVRSRFKTRTASGYLPAPTFAQTKS